MRLDRSDRVGPRPGPLLPQPRARRPAPVSPLRGEQNPWFPDKPDDPRLVAQIKHQEAVFDATGVRPGQHPSLTKEEFDAIETRLAAIVGPVRARLVRVELDHSRVVPDEPHPDPADARRDAEEDEHQRGRSGEGG